MKRVTYVWIAGVILAGMMASYASAQDSTPPPQSLGDYARAQRKDKKTAPAKQFDNDNLPMDDKLSVVGGSASTRHSDTIANRSQWRSGPAPTRRPTANPPSTQPGESAGRPAKGFRRVEGQTGRTERQNRLTHPRIRCRTTRISTARRRHVCRRRQPPAKFRGVGQGRRRLQEKDRRQEKSRRRSQTANG
jgi:hypothetical protein